MGRIMTYQPATNRRFYEGPDVETLNILIELGEIVKHSEPIVWDIVPKNLTGVRESLLKAAADAILGIKALRSVKARLTEAKPDPRDQEVPDVIDYEGLKRPKPYDFRLPVFPRGDAA